MWTPAAYSPVWLVYGHICFVVLNVAGAAYTQVRLIVQQLRYVEHLPSGFWAVCELTCTSHLTQSVFFSRQSQMMVRFPQALFLVSGIQTSSAESCNNNLINLICLFCFESVKIYGKGY